MLRSCILALKGCDSSLISLDGRVIESKLIKKFKVLLVQRRLINIALDNMLIAIVDPSVSSFVSCMRYWIFLVDSSLDFLLDDLQSKALGMAGLLSKVHLQTQIIRWLFAIIAPFSMLSSVKEIQFVHWNSLALMVYNTSRFWERFPYRYDLLATLGAKIHITQILLDNYLSKRTKRMFHRDTVDPPIVVEAYIQAILYHDLYNHVAAAMSNSNNTKKLYNVSFGSEVGVGSFANIVSIDSDQLWQQQLEAQQSDSTNLLFRVIRTLKLSSVMSTVFSAISSERGGMSVTPLDLNPMNLFDYELETFAKKQFDVPPIREDEKLQVIFNQQLNMPVVDMSSQVRPEDIPPAAKTSPNKKKAMFFDHHPPPSTPSSSQPSKADHSDKMTMITLPLGAMKSVNKNLAAEAAQDMIQRFANISQNAEYRKMKAVWQIRRLKRLKASKSALKELYNDLSCKVYLNFQGGEVASLPTKTNDILRIQVHMMQEEGKEEQQELPSVSRFEEDWLNDDEQHPTAVSQPDDVGKEDPDLFEKIIACTIDKSSGEALSETKLEPNIIVVSQQPEDEVKNETKDNKTEENNVENDDDDEDQLDLVKHFQEDNSIATEVNEELIEQQRVQAIIARLRESLRTDGLQVVLQGEESIRELCRDIHTSVLLVGLANGAFAINFSNTSNLLLSANKEGGQSSLSRLLKSVVELSYRGVLLLSDAYCLQMKVKDIQLSHHRNQVLLKQLVFEEQFLEHVKSFHEFFLMSSQNCSSFLFDVCQHVVEKRFKRLIKRDTRHYQQQHEEEELWSRVSLQLALREAMTYFPPAIAAHFKLAKYRFTASHLQTRPSFQEVTWMDYSLPSSFEWSVLLTCAELYHLKVSYEVPNEQLCGLFFAEEFMDNISKFTKRYLELGQLISCFRILSIEARRNRTMNDRQQRRGSNLHLQLFSVQQTIQSLLRYFNDRQVALMTRLYQLMSEHCHAGLQSLLILWQDYGHDLRRATFTPTHDEMRITNTEIANESLESGVLLKFCVEKILQECRLFAVRLFELLFHEASDEHDETEEDRVAALEDELQISGGKVEEYKLHIQELSRSVHQADMREHVLRLEQLLCPHS